VRILTGKGLFPRDTKPKQIANDLLLQYQREFEAMGYVRLINVERRKFKTRNPSSSIGLSLSDLPQHKCEQSLGTCNHAQGQHHDKETNPDSGESCPELSQSETHPVDSSIEGRDSLKTLLVSLLELNLSLIKEVVKSKN